MLAEVGESVMDVIPGVLCGIICNIVNPVSPLCSAIIAAVPIDRVVTSPAETVALSGCRLLH